MPKRFKIHGSGIQGSSFNWSGYAVTAPNGTSGLFTAILGTFTVPTVDTSLPGAQYSSDWVGIGGYADSTLIQAGVEADNFNGNAIYDAWTELLPAGEDEIPNLAVNPGDTVTATIVETAHNTWKIKIADDSTGAQVVRKVHYKSSGASAEAIMERPCILRPCDEPTDLAALAQTSEEVFDPVLTATSAPSTSPDFEPLLTAPAGSSLQYIVMDDNSGVDAIATPSNANTEGDGFSVADGDSQPDPPN